MSTEARRSHPCFGCTTPIADEPGNYYCVTCIAEQAAMYGDEQKAFDDYHRFADECARRSS